MWGCGVAGELARYFVVYVPGWGRMDAIIAALGGLQSSLSGVSELFTGGFFWFAMFGVGMVLLLVGVFVSLAVEFFKRLLWRS